MIASSPMTVRFERLRAGEDAREREALIRDHMYLVNLTAKRCLPFSHPSVDWDDLRAAGRIGLIQAVDRYDPARGFAFPTLAVSLIKGAIRDCLRKWDPLSRRMRDYVKDYEQAQRELTGLTGEHPTNEEIAAHNGWGDALLRRVVQARNMAYPSSLDVIARNVDDEDPDRVMDLLRAEDPGPEQHLLKKERDRALHDAIALLPERERMVINRYYFSGETAHQIAAAEGVSTSRIFQNLTSATKRLQKLLTRALPLFE